MVEEILSEFKYEDRKEALKQKTGTDTQQAISTVITKFGKPTYRQMAFNTKPTITRTFIWAVMIFRIPDTDKNIPQPVPKFWQIPLPREQSNPKSRQDILRFPESRTAFWSNPGSREYPSRPCCIGICDEIDDVMITSDEKTILEIQATI